MAVRRMVRKLSSKCAIDTPTTCWSGDVDVPQLEVPIRISRAASTPANRTIRRDTLTPSGARAAMAIAIGDNRGHDDSTFHDVLDVGVKADEREPARHDAQDDRSDDGAGNAPNPSREGRPADHRGGNRVELVRHAHPRLPACRTRRGDHTAETRE